MPDKRTVTLRAHPTRFWMQARYFAVCTEATFDWARQWKKWMARLVLEPQNYRGRPYQGRLCKFLSLGRDPERPFAGHHSDFRKLFVEVNGAQPTGTEITMRIFEGRLNQIAVETVRFDRNGKERQPEHWYSITRRIHLAAAPTPQPSNPSPLNPSTHRNQTTHSTNQHSNAENIPLTERETQSSVSCFFGAAGCADKKEMLRVTKARGSQLIDHQHSYPGGGLARHLSRQSRLTANRHKES